MLNKNVSLLILLNKYIINSNQQLNCCIFISLTEVI